MNVITDITVHQLCQLINRLTTVIPRADIRQQTRDLNAWQEITLPKVGDRVYVYDVDFDEHEGTIVEHSTNVYVVSMDDKVTVPVGRENFRVLYDRETARYEQFWLFNRPEDAEWLKSPEGLRCASINRFRVYQNEQGDCILGTDASLRLEVWRQWGVFINTSKEYGHDLCNV